MEEVDVGGSSERIRSELGLDTGSLASAVPVSSRSPRDVVRVKALRASNQVRALTARIRTMKNQQTFGLILGTTCLATIAMTQVGRPGDAAARDRQTPVAGQGNADSLLKVQQRLQQAVTTEMRAGAMKHDVSIDERAVMISLFGERGLVAGAPVSQMTGLDGQRKPNDPDSTTGSGGDQDKRAAGTTTDNQDVLGVIFLSRELAPSANSGQGATGRTPGASGGQSGTTGTTGGQSGSSGTQDPQNRDAAGQGTTTQDSTGSNQLMGFEVRRSQRGQGVELVDESGQVAMHVELLGGVNMSGTREASAPREGREGREGRGREAVSHCPPPRATPGSAGSR